MEFNQIASRLVEKLYSVKGTNQVNEIQALIVEALELAHLDGHVCHDAELHGMSTHCPHSRVI